MRILIVEDELRLVETLKAILKKHKFAVDIATDGINGEAMSLTGIYDVIVLDRMLPNKEGIEILKTIRAHNLKTPVLFLTAKDAIALRVEGLDAGADDYLVKPFATDELMARIRALGRRSENKLSDNILKVGSLSFDPQRLEIYHERKVIKLTVKESQLLELLIRNCNQVLTKEQIFDRVWGFDDVTEINIVEIYIHYLRRKIQLEQFGVTIETIRGIGYCLKEIG